MTNVAPAGRPLSSTSTSVSTSPSTVVMGVATGLKYSAWLTAELLLLDPAPAFEAPTASAMGSRGRVS